MKLGIMLILVPLLLTGCEAQFQPVQKNDVKTITVPRDNRATIYGNPLGITQISLLVNNDPLEGSATLVRSDMISCDVVGEFGDLHLETSLEIETNRNQPIQIISIDDNGILIDEIAELLPADIKCAARLVDETGTEVTSAFGGKHRIMIDHISQQSQSPANPAGVTPFNGASGLGLGR